MPYLSREPGPALRWVQLRVDVGQKPVEHPTTQPPLQLQAFCEVWLLSLREEKDTDSETGKACCSPPFTCGGGTEVAEGVGQREGTKARIPQGCRQGGRSCVGRRGLKGTE